MKTPQQWERRRTEIREIFDNEIYGHIPENIPAVNWRVISVKDTIDGDFPVIIKKLEGVVDNSSYPEVNVVMQLTVGIPAEAGREAQYQICISEIQMLPFCPKFQETDTC